MRNVMKKLWNDDCGFIVSVELLLIYAVVLLGLIVGLAALRNGVDVELAETANSIMGLSQAYSISGTTYCTNGTTGSAVSDTAGNIGTISNSAPTATPINFTLSCQ